MTITRQLQRRGTSSAWALKNETPKAGEIIFETDTRRSKLGDGVTPYNSLPYLQTATTQADVGLGNVDNTSDANKPVSTAQAAAIAAAVAGILGGAIPTLDTLAELGAAINQDPAYYQTVNSALALKAPLASPAFTGTPTVPTAAADTNTTQAASTAFVIGQASSATPAMDGSAAVGTSLRYARADHVHPTDTSRAPLASPTFTGVPAAPTAAAGTNTTQLATTAFVRTEVANLVASAPGALDTLNELANALGGDANFATTVTNALALKAPLASPALTGVPTAPTAAGGTNTTQLSTTAFVQGELSTYAATVNAALALKAPLASPSFTGNVSTTGNLQVGSGGYVHAGGLARLMLPANLQIGSGVAYAGLYGPTLTYNAKIVGGAWKSIGGGVASAITMDEGLFALWASASVGAGDADLTWTPRFKLDGSGNAALGQGGAINYTQANRTVFEVNGTTDAVLALSRGGSSGDYLYSSSGGLTVNAASTRYWRVVTNGAERLQVDSLGTLIQTSDSSPFYRIRRDLQIPGENTLGGIVFQGRYNGSSYGDGARITAAGSGEAWSDTSTPAYLAFLTTPSGSASPVEGFRLTPDAKLIVGAAYGNARLQVVAPDSNYIFGVSGATKGIRFEASSTNSAIRGVDSSLGVSFQPLVIGASTLTFQTNGATDAFLIDASQVATFAKDFTVNGHQIGRGGGSIATNLRAGNGALSASTTGDWNSAFGYSALAAITTGAQNTAVGGQAYKAATTAGYGTAVGLNAMTSITTGDSNTAVGHGALALGTTGYDNTGVGRESMYSLSTGYSNAALGMHSLYSLTTGAANTAVGRASQRSLTTGNFNVSSGYISLYSLTTGSYNVGDGSETLYSTTVGSYNVAVGGSALRANTVENYSVAVGYGALYANVLSGGQVAVGAYALQNHNGVSGNTAVGYEAGRMMTTGGYNTLIGWQAGRNHVSGGRNTMVGYQAGYAITDGNYNTGVGYGAGMALTTGERNTFLGYLSGQAATTAYYNTGVGYLSLYSLTTGGYNTGLGYQSLLSVTTAVENTAVGLYAGKNLTTGYGNVLVGSNAGSSLTGGDQSNTIIGYNITGAAGLNDSLIIGSGGVTRIEYLPGSPLKLPLFSTVAAGVASTHKIAVRLDDGSTIYLLATT